ncbi:MAG: amino acid permease [Pirellulales bacterium]
MDRDVNEDQRSPLAHDETGWGLWDAISLIVGIVIGTSIFRAPPLVFQNVSSAWGSLALWLVGGGVSLMGAWCYAELSTAFRQRGGDYHYLTLAYGPLVGFLFGWAQLTIILTASMGTMAFTFADYATRLAPSWSQHSAWLALASLVVLALLNLSNVQMGRHTQNVLTTAKVLGLTSVLLAGVLASNTGTIQSAANTITPPSAPLWSRLGLALIFVLYAYGGWNDAAMVASEVRAPERNMPRALCGGIIAITAIYFLMNVVYLRVLGLERAGAATTPAADVLAVGFASFGWSQWAERGICVLVMISALGALNGLLLTGSRLFAAWGADWPGFRWLAMTGDGHPTTTRSMTAQTVVTAALILLVGTDSGRSLIDSGVRLAHLPALQWDRFQGGFDLLLASAAPAFWLFFTMTVVAVVVLRRRHPDQPRPFRVPAYPAPVILFSAACLYMLYSAVDYAGSLSLMSLLPLGTGLIYGLLRFKRPAGATWRTRIPR